MRKILFATVALSCMMAIGARTMHAQALRLDDAIRNAVGELSRGIEPGTSLAVLSIQAGSDRMSDYIINEMIAGFLGRGGFTVVNRAQIELLEEELDFNMSGLVDDATAQSIGRFIGVQSIVTGTFEPIGAFFHFRVQVIEVETAIIRSVYSVSIISDGIIESLLEGTGIRVARRIWSLGGGVLLDIGRLGSVGRENQNPLDWRLDEFGIRYLGFGGWFFADARFVELSIGIMGGPLTVRERNAWTNITWSGDETQEIQGSFIALDISLLGKFPFALGRSGVSLFPLAGIGYSIVLASNVDGRMNMGSRMLFVENAASLSTFSIKFGGGADFDLSENVFLRTSVLGNYRFAAGRFSEVADDMENPPNLNVNNGGLGVTVKLGIGFRL